MIYLHHFHNCSNHRGWSQWMNVYIFDRNKYICKSLWIVTLGIWIETLRMLTVQEWQPRSGCDSQDSQESQEAMPLPGDDATTAREPQHETNPVDLSQKIFQDELEFQMNTMMEDLEESLPQHPLPPVAKPQVLGKQDTTPASPAKPLPTPCRADVPPPKEPLNTPLGSLQATEDWRGKHI